jgi:hypothetical protein
MKHTVVCLTKMIRKSCKLYMTEREYPPSKNEYFDSDSEYDYNDPNFFPIEQLQDQVQQMLLDYRDYISMFAEGPKSRVYTSRVLSRPYEGFQSKNSSKLKRKMSADYRIGYKRTSMKKMSIYSGSFGNHKASYTISQDELKCPSDKNCDLSSQELNPVDLEDLIAENDKMKWVPNDAYEACQI